MKTYMFKALFFGLGLLGLGVAAVYHRPHQQLPEIINNTAAIKVVSVTPGQDGPELRLRNVSTKNITGYSVGVENAYRTSDLTVGEYISPGEEITVQLPQIRNPNGAQDVTRSVPTIRFVIFDDGSSEGDDIGAQELRDIRSGRREQLNRIVVLLNAAARSLDVTQLESQLQALPTESLKTDRSFNVARGRLAAKQDVQLELSKLDKNNLQGELLKLSERNSRLVSRLNNSR
jgi:hypothetical protein